MKTHMKAVIAGVLFTASTLTQAAIVGDVTGGGSFAGTVANGDGWGTNNGVGVDFWTITVADNTELNIDVTGAFNYGISVYEGAVSSDATGNFDNDGNYSYNFFSETAVFVDGTPDLFGPYNSLYTLLADGGTYTIAIGGVDGLYQSFNYNLEVSAVPVPAAFWLFGSAFAGLMAMRRKRA